MAGQMWPEPNFSRVLRAMWAEDESRKLLKQIYAKDMKKPKGKGGKGRKPC